MSTPHTHDDPLLTPLDIILAMVAFGLLVALLSILGGLALAIVGLVGFLGFPVAVLIARRLGSQGQIAAGAPPSTVPNAVRGEADAGARDEADAWGAPATAPAPARAQGAAPAVDQR